MLVLVVCYLSNAGDEHARATILLDRLIAPQVRDRIGCVRVGIWCHEWPVIVTRMHSVPRL